MSQNRKRKSCTSFDFDTVRAGLIAKVSRTRKVQEHINELRGVEMKAILEKDYDLCENEILNIIAFKLTVQGLNNMRKALQHVPANITRIVDGTSMRHELVLGIFKSISGEPNNAISMDDLMLFANVLEKNCPTFMSQKGDFPSIELKKYLSPPVSTCINCDKKLSMRNNPSSAILFTLNGPVCCAKVSLECRDCSIKYGVCKYSDEHGARYYHSHLTLDIIEVSNVTYIHKDLYKWMPSLRYHFFSYTY